jgi:hypothetical protein
VRAQATTTAAAAAARRAAACGLCTRGKLLGRDRLLGSVPRPAWSSPPEQSGPSKQRARQTPG